MGRPTLIRAPNNANLVHLDARLVLHLANVSLVKKISSSILTLARITMLVGAILPALHQPLTLF